MTDSPKRRPAAHPKLMAVGVALAFFLTSWLASTLTGFIVLILLLLALMLYVGSGNGPKAN